MSLKRIERFFSEEEVPDWASTLPSGFDSYANDNNLMHKQLNGSSNGVGVVSQEVGFYDAVMTWHTPSSGPEQFHLELDVHFRKGLNLVIGATGSGKVCAF